MCDLFQANPWKPLLCTNCHQNRSGHQKFDTDEAKCEHLPSSSSSMHLYEEIMAQYFTVNTTDTNSVQTTSLIERLPTPIENDIDEDSFSDEEQDIIKPSGIEFIQNQSMINTQGIVLLGPELRTKQIITKKSKKIHLLKKSKSNADECLKKTDIIENNTSKLWWFKAKKASTTPIVPTEVTIESNKSNISSPTLNGQTQQQRIRVLPELNKLTLSEALNIARRQHSLSNREPKLILNNKPFRSPPISTGQSNYGSSIASTTSSSTQSSNEYDSSLLNNSTTTTIITETTYLTAIPPTDSNLSLATMLDKMNKLTIERITFDLRMAIDEYKHNLPVARFQTLKSFLHQHQSSKLLTNEAIYFLLLQIIDECAYKSIQSITMTTFDHFLIDYHSTIPIIVTATSSVTTEEESIEQFIQNLANKLFDSSTLPIFNDLPTLETVCYRYVSNQVLQVCNTDIVTSISMQRVKLLELFWSKIPSLRHIQMNEENERFIFVLYHLMRRINQSDSLI